MKTIERSDRSAAEFAVRANAGSVDVFGTLRALGKTAYGVAAPGEEAEVLVGIALAARDAGDIRMKRALNLALRFLALPTVGNDEPAADVETTSADDAPDSEVQCEWKNCDEVATTAAVDKGGARWSLCASHKREGSEHGYWKTGAEVSRRRDTEPVPPKHEHALPGLPRWRSASVRPYGGSPMRIGERALVWSVGRAVREQADEPAVAVCAGFDAEGFPLLRTTEVLATQDDFFIVHQTDYVETVDDLRPGAWTRIPW
jgi:hypothetical protein